jgi:hypothetical protein
MRDYVTKAGAFGVLFARQQVENERWPHNGELSGKILGELGFHRHIYEEKFLGMHLVDPA